ncbi:MAG: dihydroorotate dehydrogenase-like protein [Bacteroidales bacterium]
MADLRTTYLGLKLKNPIIASSSGLTSSVEEIIELENAGAAAVVLKSIFEEEIVTEMETNLKKMASSRFVYPESLEYYEDHEEENICNKYLDLIKNSKAVVKIPVIASINCVTSDYWTYFPKLIEQAGADALEINIFILPSDITRNRLANEKVYFDIIDKVVNQVKIPIALKLSYYFSDLALTLHKIAQTPVSGLVLFNKYFNPDFDLETFEVTSGKILSSPDDFHTTLRWIAIMAGRVNCSLAASTGIHDGATAVKQILAGADAVQVASTLYQNGLGEIDKMLEFMDSWMTKKNFNSIEDFKGKMSQLASDNPAAYERVQFMRYFRSYKVQK